MKMCKNAIVCFKLCIWLGATHQPSTTNTNNDTNDDHTTNTTTTAASAGVTRPRVVSQPITKGMGQDLSHVPTGQVCCFIIVYILSMLLFYVYVVIV
jgi:hypothetical protein